MNILDELIPRFFALNHTNYARWLPFILSGMQSSPESIHRHFVGEKECVITKMPKMIPGTTIDEAHKRNNRLVKDCGGATGILQNSDMLRRWMTCGPELSRLLHDFGIEMRKEEPELREHHDSGLSRQRIFCDQVRLLYEKFNELGNLFSSTAAELVSLDGVCC